MHIITLPCKIIVYLQMKSEIYPEYFPNMAFTDTEN